MISVPLTRPQRRRIKRLALENEPTIEADRRFFERRPDRNFRVRLASPAECESLRIHDGHTVDEGSRWYTAVRQVRPGWRLRAFTLGLEGLETDILEETCREVYEHAARPGTLAHHIGEQYERIAREHGL